MYWGRPTEMFGGFALPHPVTRPVAPHSMRMYLMTGK